MTSVSTHPSILSFDNANFGTIRAIEIDGEPWFIAADVARVLEYSHTPHLLRLLPRDEKDVHIVDTLGGRQEGSIISEPGLYRAIDRATVAIHQAGRSLREVRNDR